MSLFFMLKKKRRWFPPTPKFIEPQNSALYGDFLFHLSEDPQQKRNLIMDRPQERERMIELLKRKMIEVEAPPEQWIRMGLSQTE